MLKSDGSPCVGRWLFSTIQNCDFSQVDISGTIRVISLKFRFFFFPLARLSSKTMSHFMKCGMVVEMMES